MKVHSLWLPFAAALLIGAAALLQAAMDRSPSSRPETFLYLPERRAIRHFAFGNHAVVADLLYVSMNGYARKHMIAERDFRFLYEILDTITYLDPFFVRAYHQGSVLLAGLALAPEEAVSLLEKGLEVMPECDLLAVDLAGVYLMDMGRPDKAAQVMEKYGARPGAPPVFRQIAEGLRTKDPVQFARKVWTKRLQSDSPLLRHVARERLLVLDTEEIQRTVQEYIRAYREAVGAAPASLDELTRLGIAVPAPPLGGAWHYDPREGRLLSLELARRRLVAELGAVIRRFQRQKGRRPRSLSEAGIRVPAGLKVAYDPESGRVSCEASGDSRQ